MSRTVFAMALIITAGCGRAEQSAESASPALPPLLIIQFRNTEESPDLPWGISRGRSDVSSSMLIGPAVKPPAYGPVIRETLDMGMLLAMVSDSITDLAPGSDGILIRTDDSGAVRALPGELMESLPDSMELDVTKNHQLLLELWEFYRPDMILIDISVPDPARVLELAEFWTSPGVLSSYRVVLYSLSRSHCGRGWFAAAGRGICGSTPRGVTETGLFATVRMLAGLDWFSGLPRSVPAMSIMEDPDEVWRTLP
ncbi:MAG: hypothetical protein R6U39_04775 [Candidatus Aegiribacteria sp.]